MFGFISDEEKSNLFNEIKDMVRPSLTFRTDLGWYAHTRWHQLPYRKVVVSRTICYRPRLVTKKVFCTALLHELGHHINDHYKVKKDNKQKILQVETEAWDTAEELANRLGWEFDTGLMYIALKSYAKEVMTMKEKMLLMQI